MKLKFYKMPLKDINDCGYIYDNNGNFMFQFYDEVPQHIIEEIMYYLNRDERPTRSNFRIHPDDPIVIQCKSYTDKWVDCILIRGWGNLTGVGAHNLSTIQAMRIQDRLVEWLLYKLNK